MNTLEHTPSPLLGCVVMASGLGKRFGGNKLMADFDGKPLIQWALNATDGLFQRRVVVTRHESVAELCLRQHIPVVLHRLPYRSDTVRLGLEAVGLDMDGCFFLTSDQPLLQHETVEAFVTEYAKQQNFILRAAYGERVGSPVLFPKWAFEELRNLPVGKGGGAVIKSYPQLVKKITVSQEWELDDIDTQEDLQRLLMLKRKYSL